MNMKTCARYATSIVALLLSVSACGSGTDEAIWTEEVKLHDGSMVQVWRRAKAYSWGFPNSRRGRDIEFELRYEPLNVHWKGDPHLLALSFEIFDGVPYLVLYNDGPGNCDSKKSSDYAAKFLCWDNGKWKEISQGEFPVDQALINLYQEYWGRSPNDKTLPDAKGLITWRHKAKYDGFYADKPDTVQQYFERGGIRCDRLRNKAKKAK